MRKRSLMTVLLVIVTLVGITGAAENQADQANSGSASGAGTEGEEGHKVAPVITTIIGAGAEEKGHNVPTVSASAQNRHSQIFEHHEAEEEEKSEEYESSEESKSLKARITDDTGMQKTEKGELWVVTDKCLDCLCDLATDCSLRRKCETPDPDTTGLEEGMHKGDCGPFHISFPFWADANNKKMELSDAQMEEEWKQCSLDLECTTETIQKYFKKYPHDCNKDGKVDCLDYAAIHTLGPFGCLDEKKLNLWNNHRRKGILQCLVNPKKGAYAGEMKKIHLQNIAGWAKKEKAHTEESLPEVEIPEEGTNAEAPAQHVKQH